MKKKLVVLLTLVMALTLSMVCLFGCGKAAETQNVSLKVDATAAVEKGYTGKAVIFEGNVDMPKDGTVGDALEAAKLAFDAQGDFVSSINGIGTGQYGSMSGWTYTVNGTSPNEGMAKVKAGDKIEFVYVTEFK